MACGTGAGAVTGHRCFAVSSACLDNYCKRRVVPEGLGTTPFECGIGGRQPENFVYTGSCLCGGVKFRIMAELEPLQVCHCSQCRKAQGGPLATNTPVQSAAFELLCGAELLSAYTSSPGKQRVFCSTCGSPVYSRKDSLPGVLRLRAGLIDGSLAVRPVAHFHTASKANWWPVNDGLPQFEAAYTKPAFPAP